MLRKFRIEVEEASPDECVETLSKYEHALHAQEVKRYGMYFPINVTGGEVPESALDHAWDVQVSERLYYNSEVGREVLEEVIEYDPSIPAYRGRRVVAFTRIDTRPARASFEFQTINPLGIQMSGPPGFTFTSGDSQKTSDPPGGTFT